MRLHVRQPARRRGRDGRRQRRDGVRDRQRRSVLGFARRRWQLRHRHAVHVPAARGRADGVGRHAHLSAAACRRGRSCLSRLRADCARRGRQRLGVRHRARRRVRAGAGARPPDGRHHLLLPRTPRRRPHRLCAAARARARDGHGRRDALRRGAGAHRARQPEGVHELLDRRLLRRAPRRGHRHARRNRNTAGVGNDADHRRTGWRGDRARRRRRDGARLPSGGVQPALPGHVGRPGGDPAQHRLHPQPRRIVEAVVDRCGLPQLPRRRRHQPHRSELWSREVRSTARAQEQVGSDELVPAQPEHPAGTEHPGAARASATGATRQQNGCVRRNPRLR